MIPSFLKQIFERIYACHAFHITSQAFTSFGTLSLSMPSKVHRPITNRTRHQAPPTVGGLIKNPWQSRPGRVGSPCLLSHHTYTSHVPNPSSHTRPIYIYIFIYIIRTVMFRMTPQYRASISHTKRRAKKLNRFKVPLYVNIPDHKGCCTTNSLLTRPIASGRSPPACSVRQPMVPNVSSHAGTRKGAIQRPTRGGGPHRPSAFPARGTRPRGSRQRPPSRARRDPRPQHGPITRTYVRTSL